MELPGQPTYLGVVLIDAEGRVTLDAREDASRPAKFRGYVDRREAAGIKIVITDGTKVAFVYCARESNDRLHCYASREDGKSEFILLARVGAGPLTLVPR